MNHTYIEVVFTRDFQHPKRVELTVIEPEGDQGVFVHEVDPFEPPDGMKISDELLEFRSGNPLGVIGVTNKVTRNVNFYKIVSTDGNVMSYEHFAYGEDF